MIGTSPALPRLVQVRRTPSEKTCDREAIRKVLMEADIPESHLTTKPLGKMLRLLITVFFAQVSWEGLTQDTDSLKCWCRNDRLKWSDFAGKKPENDASKINLHATSAFGIIPILSSKNDILTYQVKVVFWRYDSWKTDTAKYLLNHEQLHFDMAELTARKIRKAIQGIPQKISRPTEQDFDVAIQKLFDEDAIMQDEYDNDTVHGIIPESQIKWEKKISVELKNLEKYMSTPADCPF